MNVKNTVIALALLGLGTSSVALADEASSADADSSAVPQRAVGLVQTVLEYASKYEDVDRAINDGYVAATGCVSGPVSGANGVHYVRFDLIGDGVLEPTTPEVLLYEPTRGGQMRLVGAEYLTIKEAWHAVNGIDTPPIVGGQHMFLLDEPNRFVIPAAYALRVWAFKHSPAGMFALFNPSVSCDDYAPDGTS